jgi:hypothetical protein
MVRVQRNSSLWYILYFYSQIPTWPAHGWSMSEMHQQSSKLPAMFKTVLKLRICLAALFQLALNVHLRSKIQRPTELGPH